MMKESKLQSQIIKNLDLSGWEVHKVMKSSKAGWPDIEAFKDGLTIFIETKSEGKDARPLQKFRHRKLEKQGFRVYVIDVWDQYLQLREELINLGK